MFLLEDFPAQLVMTTDFPVNNDILDLLMYKSANSINEICGFLIKKNGVYDSFKECSNIHPDPQNYFLISPKECIFDGDPILFHSHPISSDLEGFSEWDLENQQYFYLQILVYSVKNNKFYYKSI